jgi:hypothetical protein
MGTAMSARIYLPPPPSFRDQVAGLLLSLVPARASLPLRLRLTPLAGPVQRRRRR